MNKIKLIFIGTGDIGVKLLKSLHDNPQIEVVLVVTGIDKPFGRKMQLQPNAIKELALEVGLEVFQPESIKSPESVEKLKKLSPDIMLVMAYGQLLSQEVLDVPKIDCLNVHASLLPKYRGASPIQSVILKGETKTGVSLMKMVKQMDAGAVYEQFEIKLAENETTGSLEEKLSQLAAQEVPNSLFKVAQGELKAIEQNEAEVTSVTKISKTDGEINWNEPAEMIERKIRAFNPWPSVYIFFKGKRLKIIMAKAHDLDSLELPGTVVQHEDWTGVATGKGILELIEVQPGGKKPQKMKEFLNGNIGFLKNLL